MGNYIIHFDDGSEALAHYGKKGMHWGKWNEETRERYLKEGRGEYNPGGFVGNLDHRVYEWDYDTGEPRVYDVSGDHSKRDYDAEARWRHDLQEAQYAKDTNQDFDINTGKAYERNLLGRAERGIDNIVENVRTGLRDVGLKIRNIAWDVEFEGKYFVNHTLPETVKRMTDDAGDFVTSHLVDPDKVKRIFNR